MLYIGRDRHREGKKGEEEKWECGKLNTTRERQREERV
jgi:hypothetical protein